jgi:hypothetical protein
VRRTTGAATLAGAVAMVLTGCDGGRPAAQFAPDLPPGAGYRVAGADLAVWTGTPCSDVTRITVRLDSGSADSTATVWEAAEPSAVERFSLERPPAGFEVAEPFPPDADWREAATVSLLLDGGDAAWSSVVDVADVVEGSGGHDPSTYLFDDLGWYDEEAVAAGNGTSFLTVCTPEP